MPVLPPHITNFTTFKRFPVVSQLVILGILLVMIFSPWLKEQITPTQNNLSPIQPALPQPTNTATITLPQKISDVPIEAKSAYVWDVANQRVLFAKNPNDVLPLASLTKLMTSLVAIELTDPNQATAVPLSAIRQEGSSGLSAGESLSLRALSQLALIASSNDAAHALAASVGRALDESASDNTAQFIKAMNIRANELGFSSLAFKNATGLDLSPTEAGAYGTARDVTFLLEYILRTYPELLTITQAEETRVLNEAGEYHSVVNTNHIVQDIPNVLASKTGYTDLAGGNLTIAYDAGFNRPIIITVLGSSREGRFADVLTLLTAVTPALVVPNN